MRCPVCGEANSDKAAVCELCQASLTGKPTAPAPRQTVAPPTPAVPPAPPPTFHLPQPTAKRGHGALATVIVLWVVGAGAVTAYRFLSEPSAQLPANKPAPVRMAELAAEPAVAEPFAAEPAAQPDDQPSPAPGQGGPAPNQPIIEIKPDEPRAARSVSSSWFEGADGLARAKKEQAYANVPMIIYFRVDWCPYCQRMDQDISSTAVGDFLANVVKVRINPESSPADGEVARSMGVKSFPSVFAAPFPGSSPQKIQSLSRKANEPLELSATKFIDSAKQAGIRQAHNQMVAGVDKLRQGDDDGARADLDRAIEMNPKNPDAYFWRGEADTRAGELGRAVGNFKRVLELAPERKDAMYALAAIYAGNREYDEAIMYLTRAIRVDPDFAHGTGYAQRALAHKTKGDVEAAKADYAEACKRGTTRACAEAK